MNAVLLSQVDFGSTHGCSGSYPEYDEAGHLVGYGVCKPSATLEVLRSLCLKVRKV